VGQFEKQRVLHPVGVILSVAAFQAERRTSRLTGPARTPNCTTTEIQNLRKPNLDGFSRKTSDREAYKKKPEKTVVGRFGLRAGPVAREIPRPAGENAELRDDADGEKYTLLFKLIHYQFFLFCLLMIPRNRLLPRLRFNHRVIFQQLASVLVIEILLIRRDQQMTTPSQRAAL
jgi:hypothetical protein